MKISDKTQKELVHYGLVYGTILASWVPVMNYWKNDLALTAISVGIIYVTADKIAHKLFKQ